MSCRSGRDCAAMTTGTTAIESSRNRIAVPAPGPAPGQKPWIAATPIRIANCVPRTSSSRRRSVWGTGSAWTVASLGDRWDKSGAYCGNGEDWCTAPTAIRDGDQSTVRPRRLGPATGLSGNRIVAVVRDDTSRWIQVAVVARRRPGDGGLVDRGRLHVRDDGGGDCLRPDHD